MKRYKEKVNLSEMDSQRALLDSLMGINRNNDREADELDGYKDDRLCKFFLCGLCPHGNNQPMRNILFFNSVIYISIFI